MLNWHEILTGTMTCIFLLAILSYYGLIFYRARKKPPECLFNSLTIIIPTHNEELYIEATVRSAQRAVFHGSKEIIVIDDGSTDRTPEILSRLDGIKVIKSRHSGKAISINRALRMANGELIAVLDADTEIANPNSLMYMKADLERPNTGGTTCPITVKNKDVHILIYWHIEQLYNSLLKSVMAKVNANIAASGQFSMFRRQALVEIGGFSSKGLSEDMDIAIRLIRHGYHLAFTEEACAATNIPEGFRSLLSQRIRYARGMINLIMRHMQFECRTLIDIYSLPLFLFTYLQAVIMGSFTLWQIASGYYTYFASHSEFFSARVFLYFLDWFSILGFIKWAAGLLSGTTPATFINQVGIISTLLTYPLYFWAFIKFNQPLRVRELLAILFIAPFWWLIMAISIMCMPQFLFPKQRNIWQKN